MNDERPKAANPKQLDPVIHERVRLALVCTLSAHESLSFSEIKRLLGLTDGNLSVHARRLEEVGYVEVRKTVEERVPRTEYRLTPGGRRALERYFQHLEAVIADTRPHLRAR
jgi:DNA-binding HxlR family transcriptional regulator